MSLDIINHNRAIYSALDFLGDVGGLLSILGDLGRIIVSLQMLLFGSKIQKYLVDNLFKQSALKLPFTQSSQMDDDRELSSRDNVN